MGLHRRSAYDRGVEFVVLGPIGIIDKGERIPLGGPKQRTVLAMCVAHAGRSVSFDRIIDAAWGDEPPDGARASLHTYISNLRSIVGDVIGRLGDGYVLRIDAEAVDAARFENMYRRASEMLVDAPERALEILREALALWSGHPYADVEARGALDPEITRLEELRLAALLARIDADLALGHHSALIGELEALGGEYPFQEGFRARQMVALYRSGRQADALRLYHRTRRYLREELGIDPSPELQRLERRILDQDPALDLEIPVAIRHKAVLVADVGHDETLAGLDPVLRAELLDTNGAAIETSVAEAGGEVFAQRGSATYASFERVADAIEATSHTYRAVGSSTLLPCFAIDVGDVESQPAEGFTGPTVSRAVALVAAAHSGQALLSADAHDEMATSGVEGWQVRSLGSHRLWGFDRARPVYQLLIEGHQQQFPPLRFDATPPALPEAGRGLFGYELRDLIGVGAVGEVYRAYQAAVGREVAVKVLKDRFVNQPEFIRRFEVEAQLVARLEHPHIVPLWDYWREPDRAYLVMRWLRGGDLAQRLRNGPVNSADASRIVGQIGGALLTAHRHGVLHRDLKPSNVMLDEEGNAYLTDFGIAPTLLSPQAPSLSNRFQFDAYAPPEVRAGQPATKASDVFSMAALTHYLLTGHPPSRSHLTEARLPSAVLDVLRDALDPDPARRPSDAGEYAGSMQEALGAPASSEPTYTPVRNPYKGLAAFSESDAGDFRGRDLVAVEILRKMAESQLVAVVGPSGIGKSSVVRAGVVPRLRSGGIPGSSEWFITEMVPGPHPFEELATALTRVATEAVSGMDDDLRRDRRGMLRSVQRCLPVDSDLVLVIDQFEELYSLTDNETREAFVDGLTTLVTDDRSPARVVITVRADYFDHPLRHAGLGSLLQKATVPVGAPTIEQLHQMVEEPAAALGVSFEPGLTGRIVGQVQGEPGALPLLEYVLTALFEARQADVITAADFGSGGGVIGALGARADATFDGLGVERQEAARQLLLRLISVDDSGRPTRRRVRRSEIMRLPVPRRHLETALDVFGEARLLTFDRDPTTRGPTVEVAHEALLWQWPRFEAWVEEQRQGLILGRRFRAALQEWESNRRHEDYLLTGQRLASFHGLPDIYPLTAEEHDYYMASLRHDRAMRAGRRRRRRMVTGFLASATLVASALGMVALVQADRAGVESRNANARRLAGDSTIALPEDSELAILLALESAYLSRDAGEPLLPETIAALHEATQLSRLELRLENAFGRVTVSPDGSRLASISLDDDSGARSVAIWDAIKGERLRTLRGGAGEAYDVAFSPDGRLLAAASVDAEANPQGGHVALYDSSSWEVSGVVARGALKVAWSPDGTLLAATTMPDSDRQGQTSVTVWEVDSLAERFAVPGGGIDPSPDDLVFADDETLLVPDREGRTVVFYDVGSGAEIDRLDTAPGQPDAQPSGLSVDSARDLLVVGFYGGDFVELWDLAARELLWSVDVPTSPRVSIDPDTGLIASGGIDGKVRLHDPDDGSVVATLGGHTGELADVAFYPHGERLVTSGFEDETRTWIVTASGSVGVLDSGPTIDVGVTDVHLSPDDREIALTLDRSLRRFDVASGELLGSFGGTMNQFVSAPVSPDWRLLAHVDSAGDAWVRDLASGAFVTRLPSCTVPRAFSHDGSMVVLDGGTLCAGRDPSDDEPRSRVIDVVTGEQRLDLGSTSIGHGSPGAVFNPAGVFAADRFLAVNFDHGLEAGRLGIYDLSGDEPIAIVDPRADTIGVDGGVSGLEVRTIAFDPTGRYLAAVGSEGRAFVLDMAQLVAGGPATDAVVFDRIVESGLLIGVDLDGDGVLATGTFGSLRLWNIHTGEHITDIPVEGDIPPQPRFSSDGDYLYYVDDPGFDLAVVRRFPMDTDELTALAESRVTRGLSGDECLRFLGSREC